MGFLLGIDEAGRGAVVGPLVVGGVLISVENERNLKKLGVKDSKELSPEKRVELFEKIRELSEDFIILQISAKQIDNEMEIKSLNEIEIERMVQIIDSFGVKKPKVFIDAVEANTLKFKGKIFGRLKNKNTRSKGNGASFSQSEKAGIEIVAENYADKNYPVVSAASILAKVTRDLEIKKLHEKYGFFGSGYPSDERTIRFLETLDNDNYNKIVRLKWATSKNILEAKKQRKLGEF